MTSKKGFFTIANVLTLIRLITSPLLAYFIITERPVLAVILLIAMILTELDGAIARRLNQDTIFGANFDTYADSAVFAGGIIGITVTGVLHYYYLIFFFFIELFYYISSYMLVLKNKAKSLHPETQVDKFGGVLVLLTIVWGIFKGPYFDIPLWSAIAYNSVTIGKRVWLGFSS